MDSVQLKHEQVEKLKQWQDQHDGVMCDHYLLRSIREGGYGEVAITDVYITLPDGQDVQIDETLADARHQL